MKSRVRENLPNWPKDVFRVVLLNLGEGGLGLLGIQKQEKPHKLAFIMSYPSAKRMGRALSALALPYKMGGSMGVQGLICHRKLNLRT